MSKPNTAANEYITSQPSISLVTTPDISRCTLDCRRITEAVDPTFIAQWRRTYTSDVTRFLLIYCEEADSNQKRRSSQAGSDSATTISESWYFCGQTGEGEYLEGILQADASWLKDISADARNCLLNLPKI